ncbi:Maf family protein [soil metagenome]
MKPIILASASPRRTEILRAMGIPHEVRRSGVDESKITADHPRTFALRAAFAKALDVAAQVEPGRWVLAADTVVTRNLLLYGKPPNADHARRVLAQLSGETHEVITAVALAEAGAPNVLLRSVTTQVTFKPLFATDIAAYVATGEPLDKAGAYGIQGKGADLIAAIRGDYFNVVGLPCSAVAELLDEAGLSIPYTIPEAPGRWRP